MKNIARIVVSLGVLWAGVGCPRVHGQEPAVAPRNGHGVTTVPLPAGEHGSDVEQPEASEEAVPWLWGGFGLDFGIGKGSSVGDGSSPYDPVRLTPLRVEAWFVLVSFAALRLAAAYDFSTGYHDGHFFVPSVALRFGRMQALDAMWSVTASCGYQIGTTQTYIDGPGTNRLGWVPAEGPILGLSADIRFHSNKSARHTISFGVEVGSIGSDGMLANQYDHFRIWMLATAGVSLNWAVY